MISSSKKRSYKTAIFFSAQQVPRNSTPTDSALSFCLDKDHWFPPAGLKHIVLLSFQLLEKSEYLPAVLNCRECYAGQWSKRGGTSSESDVMSKFHWTHYLRSWKQYSHSCPSTMLRRCNCITPACRRRQAMPPYLAPHRVTVHNQARCYSCYSQNQLLQLKQGILS